MPRNISRRRFIGEASCAAVGSTTLFSTLASLFMTNTLAAQKHMFSGDYKALVCVLLTGGNDSYNMLLPRGNAVDEYDHYQATRADLALSQGSLLPLTENTPDPGGAVYGAHPSMGDVAQMFDDGNLAYIANVGTLVEPILNSSEYYSGLKNRPLGLYSHADQVEQWQTSVPHSREAVGWGGKLADIMHSQNSFQGISMNISLAGRNVFQSGNETLEYAISNDGNGAEGIEPIMYQSNEGFLNYLRNQAIDSLVSDMYGNVFKTTFAEQMRTSLEAQQIFANAIASVSPFTTNFSDHYLSENMEMVAKVISARQELGMSRQIFFMTFGGWDHHNEVINNQLYMLGVVNNALKEFYDVLQEIGMENDVTTFTISDFARTLTSNGQGSDHAWGGNQIVMGGAVNGREIYGQYPDLSLSSSLNVSNRGVLIPTTSTDEVFAELALWFGLDPGELTTVFPNITNFYSPGSPDWPIGFLQP